MKDKKVHIDNIPMLVAIVNEDGEVVYINKYMIRDDIFSKIKDKNINDFIKEEKGSNNIEFVIDDRRMDVTFHKTRLDSGKIIIFINSEYRKIL